MAAARDKDLDELGRRRPVVLLTDVIWDFRRTHSESAICRLVQGHCIHVGTTAEVASVTSTQPGFAPGTTEQHSRKRRLSPGASKFTHERFEAFCPVELPGWNPEFNGKNTENAKSQGITLQVQMPENCHINKVTTDPDTLDQDLDEARIVLHLNRCVPGVSTTVNEKPRRPTSSTSKKERRLTSEDFVPKSREIGGGCHGAFSRSRLGAPPHSVVDADSQVANGNTAFSRPFCAGVATEVTPLWSTDLKSEWIKHIIGEDEEDNESETGQKWCILM